MKKKKIVIFVDWYVPGYKAGGPIKSIFSLVSYLKDDYDFLIITSDTDFGEALPYPGIKSDTWIQADPSVAIFYASKTFQNKNNLLTLLQSLQYDGIYLNSFFSPWFSVMPLLLLKRKKINGPLLIAPRGMLGAGALKLKPLKKKIFIVFSKIMGLHKKVVWHATSAQEKEEITAVLGTKAKVVVASNLQFDANPVEAIPFLKQKNEVTFFFLSRISEKKNLIFILELLKKADKKSNITFNIFGPVEDEDYWKKCLLIIEELKKSGLDVNYHGAIRNEHLAAAIATSHFMILPTFNENYGHVIVESFANGKPVIISDQTPWRDLEKSNAGWDISLNNIAKFETVIKQCIQMSNDEYLSMQQSAITYSKIHCNSNDALIATKEIFKKISND